MTMLMEVNQMTETLEQTVSSVFETMMGVDIAGVQAGWSTDSSRVTATLHFAGVWSAVLMLEVTRPLACFLAGHFLDTEPPQEVNDDVRDVVGELANMVGGNLKSVLAPGALLSIPEVIDGKDFNLRISAGKTCAESVFRCEAGLFRVTLIETPGSVSRG